MTAYVVAHVMMADSGAYERFLEQLADMLGLFDGRLLVSDPKPRVVEGNWRGDKVVLIQFPDAESFDDCIASDEYKAIKAGRAIHDTSLVLLASDAA